MALQLTVNIKNTFLVFDYVDDASEEDAWECASCPGQIESDYDIHSDPDASVDAGSDGPDLQPTSTAKPKGHLDPPWCPTNTNKRHRPTFFAVLRFLFQNNFNSKEAVITLTTKKWPDQFFHLVSDARGNDRVATRTGGGTQTQSESKGKPTDGGTENPWSDGGLLLSASNIWTPLSDSRRLYCEKDFRRSSSPAEAFATMPLCVWSPAPQVADCY